VNGGGHKKKKHDEKHGNHERWLITYADMITLLMAFFIMMYSMSVVNLAKFRDVAFSIRSGFGGSLRGAGPGGAHLFLEQSGGGSRKSLREGSPHAPVLGATTRTANGADGGTDPKSRKGSRVDLATELSALAFLTNVARVVDVRRDRRGVVVSVAPDELFFGPGSAALSPHALEFIGSIASLLAVSGNDIVVEGHTDPAPVRSSSFASNWALSSARASAVTAALEERGVPGTRLTAIGFSDTRRREARGLSPEGTNRRVDIVVVERNSDAARLATQTSPLPATLHDAARPGIRPVLSKVWRRGQE
jgi:chemotaxis protein MotB